jgi:hypothetical protein
MIKWALFFVICVYSLLDTYQSWLLFAVGCTEWNPILNYIGNQMGLMPGIIMTKLIMLVGLGLALRRVE